MSSNEAQVAEEEFDLEFSQTLLGDPDLPADVREELSSEKFKNRMHYSRATYAKGCRGPLCKLAERDRARDRSEQKAIAAGRVYEANWDERLRRAREFFRDDELYPIVHQHLREVEMARLRRRDERRWGPPL